MPESYLPRATGLQTEELMYAVPRPGESAKTTRFSNKSQQQWSLLSVILQLQEAGFENFGRSMHRGVLHTALRLL